MAAFSQQKAFAQRTVGEDGIQGEIPAEVKANGHQNRLCFIKCQGERIAHQSGPDEYDDHGHNISKQSEREPVINTKRNR